MKTIASLMLVIALSSPLVSIGADDVVTHSLDALTAVPHTTLDPSVRPRRSGVLLDFDISALTVVPEFTGGFGKNRMPVADASTANRLELEPVTPDGDVDANNMIDAQVKFADARKSREVDNIRWHSVADIALVVNNG